jgi:AcrR family transcriptional regulator
MSRGSMATPESRVDGRLARGLRARGAIVDAMLALIREGDLRPSAARVAERAGVSLRTVFQHFRDVESLFAAVAGRQEQHLREMIRPLPTTGALALRIRAFVAQRGRVLEDIAPVRRAAILSEPFSATIARKLVEFRRIKAEEVRAVFAAELAALPATERRTVTAALVVASSWSTWEALRAHQGLSVAQARRVMECTMAALLGGAR